MCQSTRIAADVAVRFAPPSIAQGHPEAGVTTARLWVGDLDDLFHLRYQRAHQKLAVRFVVRKNQG